MYHVPSEAPCELAQESPLLPSSLCVGHSTLKSSRNLYKVLSTKYKVPSEVPFELAHESLICTKYQVQSTMYPQKHHLS